MSEPSSPGILPDVNLWLATVLEPHPHHGRAIRWWRRDVLPAGGRVLFCRITQLGLLRLLCHRKVMGSARRSPGEAWKDYALLLDQACVGFLPEPEGLGPVLHEITMRAPGSSGLWTDAYLAAFARLAELELVTFDRGFRRFEQGLSLTLLG